MYKYNQVKMKMDSLYWCNENTLIQYKLKDIKQRRVLQDRAQEQQTAVT